MSSASHFDTHFILVRGLAREARHWGSFPDQLVARFAAEGGGTARADALDLPGAGRFSEMRCPPSVPQMTEFVREKYFETRRKWRDSLAPDEPIKTPKKSFLVAMSLGGMIASNWFERWPSDFAGCVLINTSFRGFSPFHQRLTPASMLQLAGILSERDVLKRERKALALVSNRPDLYEKVASEWTSIQHSRPVSLENFARQLVAASRFRPALRAPPIPILILNSSGDRMVHHSCSKKIAKEWGVEIHCHAMAGHDLPLDDPDWVAEKIAGWVKNFSD